MKTSLNQDSKNILQDPVVSRLLVLLEMFTKALANKDQRKAKLLFKMCRLVALKMKQAEKQKLLNQKLTPEEKAKLQKAFIEALQEAKDEEENQALPTNKGTSKQVSQCK